MKDLSGLKFGKLTVLKFINKDKNYHCKWLCQCDCGNQKEILDTHLITGKIKSCGCLNKEKITKHGQSHSKLYYIYYAMKQRCYKKNAKNYKNYGGRGIKICNEWLNNFISFYNWAIKNGYKEDAKRGQFTIDRINVNGNYEPNNCRWINIIEQQKNKQKTT